MEHAVANPRTINPAVVHALLSLAGVTQREMAAWLNVSESTASRRIANPDRMSSKDIGVLAARLGRIPVDVFYLETGEALERLIRPLNPDDGQWAPSDSNRRPMGRRSTAHLHVVEPLAA